MKIKDEDEFYCTASARNLSTFILYRSSFIAYLKFRMCSVISVISVSSVALLYYLRCENSDEFKSAQKRSSNAAERFCVWRTNWSAVFISLSVGSRESARK
jgi:hypothetical protein